MDFTTLNKLLKERTPQQQALIIEELKTILERKKAMNHYWIIGETGSFKDCETGEIIEGTIIKLHEGTDHLIALIRTTETICIEPQEKNHLVRLI